MTVIILRDVLKEMQVPFKLSDKKAVLFSKLTDAGVKDDASLNCTQDSSSCSSFTTQSTQEVPSDQEIIEVNSLKSSPQPKIEICHNDDCYYENHYHTVMYHYCWFSVSRHSK